MDTATRDKLNSTLSRCNELTAQLSDAALLKDAKEYRRAATAHGEIADVVETYREFLKLEKEVADLGELIAAENDQELLSLAKEERAGHLKRLDSLGAELRRLMTPKDPNDGKNVIMEIRAGTGGEEAALFAADLFRMYHRYAERHGWKLELLSANETGLGGFKEIIFAVEGKDAYMSLKHESGVHRVQRVPDTEASGRIHTSAVTVAILPEAEEVDLQIDPKDIRVDVFRSSGPGGQSVNTTDSAVRITHIPTGVTVSCQDEKSQHKNKAKAMRVLRSRLLEIRKQEHDAQLSEARRSQVGSGDRSEKIRTYNFPQNRVTDHRIKLTLHKIDSVLDGDMDELMNALAEMDQVAGANL